MRHQSLLQNILVQNLLYGNSVAGAFNKLWKDTSTFTIAVWNDGTTIGSTWESLAVSGMNQYLDDMGKEDSVITTETAPSFTFFKNIINNNASGILSYKIEVTSGETSWHAINVVGYCQVMVNGVYYNYLIVANGWDDDAVKYIAFNRIDFVHSLGMSIVVQ